MLHADKRQRRMVSLKISNWMLAGVAAVLSATAITGAQTASQTQPGTAAPAAPAQAAPAQAAPAQKPGAPLQLQDMGQTGKADPFPPVNQKYFTASSPSVVVATLAGSLDEPSLPEMIAKTAVAIATAAIKPTTAGTARSGSRPPAAPSATTAPMTMNRPPNM